MIDLITKAEALQNGVFALANEAAQLTAAIKEYKEASETPQKVSDITGFPEDDLQE